MHSPETSRSALPHHTPRRSLVRRSTAAAVASWPGVNPLEAVTPGSELYFTEPGLSSDSLRAVGLFGSWYASSISGRRPNRSIGTRWPVTFEMGERSRLIIVVDPGFTRPVLSPFVGTRRRRYTYVATHTVAGSRAV